jgi:hypothetical protein
VSLDWSSIFSGLGKLNTESKKVLRRESIVVGSRYNLVCGPQKTTGLVFSADAFDVVQVERIGCRCF